MGHSQCGGIRALMEGSLLEKKDSFIGKWVSLGQKAKDRVLADLPEKTFEVQVKACERTSVLESLENLMTFPWLKARVEEGYLVLHGWYFEIETGTLSGYNPVSRNFEVLA
jgi:carbonic anhydrase